jgi:hypothetical protein
MGEGGNLIVFYYFRASEIGVASLEGLGRGGGGYYLVVFCYLSTYDFWTDVGGRGHI